MENRRKQVISKKLQWGDPPPSRNLQMPTTSDSPGTQKLGCDDCKPRASMPHNSQESPTTADDLGGCAVDAPARKTMNRKNERIPSVSTKGWNLEAFTKLSDNFIPIHRVHASSESLSSTIKYYEEKGIPLVIEGWHEHPQWARSFNLEYFKANSGSDGMINVRNMHNGRDARISISDFIEKSREASVFASPEEVERLYGKDAECPSGWREWLENDNVIPAPLIANGPNDLLRYRSESERVETLMCYLGIGDTFTPAHKDLCASSGQNLMCYTENEGASFWFMTEGANAPVAAAYFQTLNQELDHETHVVTPNEFAKAPFKIYVAKQVLGDLVLVPPRSCHQVVNHGGITLKTSWSRMTLKGLATAYYHELSIYRRVCRYETYRVKSTIYRALQQQTKELEYLVCPQQSQQSSPAGSSSSISMSRSSTPATIKFPLSNSRHDPPQLSTSDLARKTDLATNLLKLLELLDDILAEEYAPKSREITNLDAQDAIHLSDNEKCAEHRIVCDFCGADIFQSFFECSTCVGGADVSPDLEVSGGIVICPGCYVEGRSCKCVIMEPTQCRPFEELIETRNNALKVLRWSGETRRLRQDMTLSRLEEHTKNPTTASVFRAACVLLSYRVNKKSTRTCNLHSDGETSALYCKGCHASKCFEHILTTQRSHAIEALMVHHSDFSAKHDTYHKYHQGRKAIFAAGVPDFKRSQQDGIRPDIGILHVHDALMYGTCKPIIPSCMVTGFYDVDVQLCDVAIEDSGNQSAHHSALETQGMARWSPATSCSALTPCPESDSECSLPTPDLLRPSAFGDVGDTTRILSNAIRAEPQRKREILDYILIPPAPYPIHRHRKPDQFATSPASARKGVRAKSIKLSRPQSTKTGPPLAKRTANAVMSAVWSQPRSGNPPSTKRLKASTQDTFGLVSLPKQPGTVAPMTRSNHKLSSTATRSPLQQPRKVTRPIVHSDSEDSDSPLISGRFQLLDSKGKRKADGASDGSSIIATKRHKSATSKPKALLDKHVPASRLARTPAQVNGNRGGSAGKRPTKFRHSEPSEPTTSKIIAGTKKRKWGRLENNNSPTKRLLQSPTESLVPSISASQLSQSLQSRQPKGTSKNTTLPWSSRSALEGNTVRFKTGLVVKLDGSSSSGHGTQSSSVCNHGTPRHHTLISSIAPKSSETKRTASRPNSDKRTGKSQLAQTKGFASLADAMNSAGSHNASASTRRSDQGSNSFEKSHSEAPDVHPEKLSIVKRRETEVPIVVEEERVPVIPPQTIETTNPINSSSSNKSYTIPEPPASIPPGVQVMVEDKLQLLQTESPYTASLMDELRESMMYIIVPLSRPEARLNLKPPPYANPQDTQQRYRAPATDARNAYRGSQDYYQWSAPLEDPREPRRYDPSQRSSEHDRQQPFYHSDRDPDWHLRSLERREYNLDTDNDHHPPLRRTQHPPRFENLNEFQPKRLERARWDREHPHQGVSHSALRHTNYRNRGGVSYGPARKYYGRRNNKPHHPSRWLQAAMANEPSSSQSGMGVIRNRETRMQEHEPHPRRHGAPLQVESHRETPSAPRSSPEKGFRRHDHETYRSKEASEAMLKTLNAPLRAEPFDPAYWEDRYETSDETTAAQPARTPTPVAQPLHHASNRPNQNSLVKDPVPEPYPEMENPWGP